MYSKKISAILENLKPDKEPKKKSKSSKKVMRKSSSKYANVIRAYNEYMENPKTSSNIREFLKSLLPVNNLMLKLDLAISISFFQLGKIKTLKPCEHLYHEDDPLQTMYIILWG